MSFRNRLANVTLGVMMAACASAMPATPTGTAPAGGLLPTGSGPSAATATPSPAATAAPMPSPSPSTTPALTAMQMAERIIAQGRSAIPRTSIQIVQQGVDSLWAAHGAQLSVVTWKDAPAGVLSKAYYGTCLRYIANGRDKNISAKELIDQRITFVAGFTVVQLNAFDKIEEPAVRSALAALAEQIYNYGATSVPLYPGQPARNWEELNQFIPVMLSASVGG